MSERYTKLFSLPKNLYIPGAPVLLAAGALLKDNQTETTLAQLKFRSISMKAIKAVIAVVDAFDVSGAALGGVTEYQYLDLTAERDAEFGQRQAIPLPNANTRRRYDLGAGRHCRLAAAAGADAGHGQVIHGADGAVPS